MSPDKVVQILEDCENRFRVDRWRLTDFWVWPLFRVKLELSVLGGNRPSQNAPPTPTVSRVKRILGTFKEATRSLLVWVLSRRHSVRPSPYVLAFSVGPYTNVQGRSYDNNVGPLAEWLKNMGVDTEVLTSNTSISQFALPTSCVAGQLRDLGSLGLVLAKLHRLMKWHLPDFEAAVQFLLDAEIPDWAVPSKEWLLVQAWKTNVVSRYFGSLIQKSPPIGIVPVSYYEDYGFAITLAGWRHKIPTVDLTHGVQGPAHGAYTRWPQVPASMCNLRPNGFLCWTEADASLINAWAGASIADSLGSPILTAWKESLSDSAAPLAPCLLQEGKPTVLVALWPLRAGPDEHLELVLNLVQSVPQVNWWFRLHPSQVNSPAPFQILGARGIDSAAVRAASQAPLPSLLLSAQGLVTRFSSTVLEALIVDLPCIVLGSSGRSLFSHYVTPSARIVFTEEFEAAEAVVRDLSRRSTADSFVPVSVVSRQTILHKHFFALMGTTQQHRHPSSFPTAEPDSCRS